MNFCTSTLFCDGVGPISPNHSCFSFTSSYSLSSSSFSSSSSSLTSAGDEESGMDMTCICEGDKDTEHEVGWTKCTRWTEHVEQCNIIIFMKYMNALA